ncbi:hypothetical protein DE146DRAFT_605173 [Phaeosphaeria sp. MPI-PUGE-AT-0046c]|nr:hypothetical protein DE146DRAFT_605173 [Phaeosphaeria sp. MPI-PUGE-AT-0046c]
MHLLVNTLTGKTIELYLKDPKLVSDIMEAIQKKEGIPPYQQRLIFAGKELLPEHTVSSHNILNESTLHLVLRAGPPNMNNASSMSKYIIYIKTLSGKTIVVNSDPSWTIVRMKTAIEEIEGIPSGQQRLIFDGRQLEDHRTLLDYNIKPESSLHLAISLQGKWHDF